MLSWRNSRTLFADKGPVTAVTVNEPAVEYYSESKSVSRTVLMKGLSANTNTKVRAAIVGLFFWAALFSVFYSADLSTTAFSQARRTTPRRSTVAAPPKYSSFPHDVSAHRIECGSCHKFPSSNWNKVRTGDAAFPDITDYPKHESCLGCHRQQFFRGRPPIVCSICHTNPGPRDSTRHPFPNPRELFDQSAKGKSAVSDFSISFPHDKHIDIVTARSRSGEDFFRRVSFGRSKRAEESCSVCHQTYKPQGDASDEFVSKPPDKWGDAFWPKKGTFKTTPIGHTVCFTCHSIDSGIEPSPTSCGTCHKLATPAAPTDFDPKFAAVASITDKIILTAWRKRDSSATFRHEWFSHSEVSCSTCHDVTAINTLDAKTKKVPVSSCGTCHATATSDDGGAMNYEIDSRRANPTFQCVKCHIAYGKSAIPDSHLKALATATGK